MVVLPSIWRGDAYEEDEVWMFTSIDYRPNEYKYGEMLVFNVMLYF
jgi:hypothetical protein